MCILQYFPSSSPSLPTPFQVQLINTLSMFSLFHIDGAAFSLPNTLFELAMSPSQFTLYRGQMLNNYICSLFYFSPLQFPLFSYSSKPLIRFSYSTPTSTISPVPSLLKFPSPSRTEDSQSPITFLPSLPLSLYIPLPSLFPRFRSSTRPIWPSSTPPPKPYSFFPDF